MPLRRTVLACAVTLVCVLAVFTLPRFAWNTVQGAMRPQQVTTPAPQAPPPSAAPRSLPQRLTGILGIALMLGLGIALSRGRRASMWRVGTWGLVIGLPVAVFALAWAEVTRCVHPVS